MATSDIIKAKNIILYSSHIIFLLLNKILTLTEGQLITYSFPRLLKATTIVVDVKILNVDDNHYKSIKINWLVITIDITQNK